MPSDVKQDSKEQLKTPGYQFFSYNMEFNLSTRTLIQMNADWDVQDSVKIY